MDIKKTAQRFLKGIRYLTCTAFIDRMTLSGYRTIYYGSVTNPIIASLHLSEFAADKDSFAFRSQGASFIFIKTGKTEQETTRLLLHEIGHIVCGHRLDAITMEDEKDADLFVNCCLKARRFYWVKDVAVGIAALSLILISVLVGMTMQKESAVVPDNEQMSFPITNIEVIVTKSGTKYHAKDCQYVAGKTDTRTLPIEEAKKEGYDPCSVCRPEEQDKYKN
jgi:hypothetical protein